MKLSRQLPYHEVFWLTPGIPTMEMWNDTVLHERKITSTALCEARQRFTCNRSEEGTVPSNLWG